MTSDWPDFRKLVKRQYSERVWVPLALSLTRKSGEFPAVGFRSQYEGVHTLVVPIQNRELGESYHWSDDYEHRPWAGKAVYKPADEYWNDDEGTVVGYRLALRQTFPDRSEFWHLHHDFVIAMGLALEGNSWVRPAESYIEVARHVIDENGDVCGIEAKSEFLRDYLCARNSVLRICSFRDLHGIFDGGSIPIGYEVNSEEEFAGGKLQLVTTKIDSHGNPAGSGVAVFRASRNDVDPEDDVPEMGPETDENVDSESWSFKRGDSGNVRVMADFWREEWLEPASASLRVRGDDVPSEVTFIVGANGERMSADTLDDEDIGRWLWFKPGIIPNIMTRRGSALQWYSRETGGISTPSNPSVHFGVNEIGLVTVYARDVARLPEWERRLWAGFNTTPEGKVCEELLMSQVRAMPSETQAPEKFLPVAFRQLNEAWFDRFGTRILRDHDKFDEILEKCHRFRALDEHGLFSLAKDLARLTADLFDAKAAQKVAPPPIGKNWSSLKSFENALATLVAPEFAREITGPLFATYDLRISDAHLPKKDKLEAYARLGIEYNEPTLKAGFKMLHMVVSSLTACAGVLRKAGD